MRFRSISFLTEETSRYLIFVGNPEWRDKRFEHVRLPDGSRAWVWAIKNPDNANQIRVALP